MNNKNERMINKYHYKFLEDKFKDLELGRAEAPYLKMIDAHSPIKMNSLITKVVFHKSHTTRAINQMEKDGLIKKQKDLNDLRSYILSITEKGKKIAKQVNQILQEWDDLVNSALSNEEIKQLDNIREKVYLKLKDYFEEDFAE
ncbi:MAG: MarR family transcriptional regulator [Candidatus Izimaplasma sp.]|nr:MarR family transcriptional regulator [Candidatus Izimaplasma bacterium]